MSKKPRTFRVVEGTSLRKSTDFEDPEYGEFLTYRPGRKVEEDKVPSHAPVAEWIKSGHWEVVEEID